MYVANCPWNTNVTPVSYGIAKDSNKKGVMEERRPNVELGYNALLQPTNEGTFSSFVNPHPSVHRIASDTFRLAIRNPAIRQVDWSGNKPRIQTLIGNPIPLSLFNLKTAFNGISTIRTLLGEAFSSLSSNLDVPTNTALRISEKKLTEIENNFAARLQEIHQLIRNQNDVIDVMQIPNVHEPAQIDTTAIEGEVERAQHILFNQFNDQVERIMNIVPQYVEQELAKIKAEIDNKIDNEAAANLLRAQLHSLEGTLSERIRTRIDAAARNLSHDTSQSNYNVAQLSARIVQVERQLRDYYQNSAQEIQGLTERYEAKLLELSDTAAKINSMVNNQQADLSTLNSIVQQPQQVITKIEHDQARANEIARAVVQVKEEADQQFSQIKQELAEANQKADDAMRALDTMKTEIPLYVQQNAAINYNPTSTVVDTSINPLGPSSSPAPFEVDEEEEVAQPAIAQQQTQSDSTIPKDVVLYSDTHAPSATVSAPNPLLSNDQTSAPSDFRPLPELPSKKQMRAIIIQQLNVFDKHKRLALLTCSLNKWLNTNFETIVDLTRTMTVYEGLLKRTSAFASQEVIDNLEGARAQQAQFCATIQKGLSEMKLRKQMNKLHKASAAADDEIFYQMFHSIRSGNDTVSEYLFTQQAGIMNIFNSVVALLNHLANRINVLLTHRSHRNVIEEAVAESPGNTIKSLELFESELKNLLDSYNRDLTDIISQLKTAQDSRSKPSMMTTSNALDQNIANSNSNVPEIAAPEVGAIPSLQGPEPILLPVSEPKRISRTRRIQNARETYQILPLSHRNDQEGHGGGRKRKLLKKKKRNAKNKKRHSKKKHSKSKKQKRVQNQKRSKKNAGCAKCSKAGCAKCGKGIKGGCTGCKKSTVSQTASPNIQSKDSVSRIV